jgi:beta-lactamase regulating signal transducer with metallopeptidase domain
MTDFLIKSTLSLATLLAVYFLILEKEKMHQFNRFYLLFSLLFSLVIPFITIEIIQEISHQETTTTSIPMTGGTSMPIPIIENSINYWLIAAWVFYGIITLSLLSRFVVNIWKLNARTQSNPIIDYKNAKLVLLQEKTLPYTFLNHIFINETDYHNRKIEAELYTHELTHVNQKHSLDILFIEMLKVLFWFNPIFIFYKKAIQLNHEFLADQKVVNSHNNVPFYQNLLVSVANANPTYYLVSNLTYSVTKKRLVMMTKNTSLSKSILKKLVLIPFLSGLVFISCVKKTDQMTPLDNDKETKKSNVINEQKKDTYYAGVQVIVRDQNKKLLLNKKYEALTQEEKNKYLIYEKTRLYPKKRKPTREELENLINKEDCTFVLDGLLLTNSQKELLLNTEIANIFGGFVEEKFRTKESPEMFTYSLQTPSYYEKEKKRNNPEKFPGDTIEITFSVNTTQNQKMEEIITKTNGRETGKKEQLFNTSELTEQPEFPGGDRKFEEFFDKNMKKPKGLLESNEVQITFQIEKDGSLSNIRAQSTTGHIANEEVVRVLELSPKWKPGEINYKAVTVLYNTNLAFGSGKKH